MSKGFNANKNNTGKLKPVQDSNNAAQLQAMTQLMVQTSQQVRQLQDEVAAIIGLIRQSEVEEVSPTDQVLVDAIGYVDGVKLPETLLYSHVVDMKSPERYVPGFVGSLLGREVGDDFEISLKFPADYYVEKLADKDVVFKINVIKAFASPANDSLVLDLLK